MNYGKKAKKNFESGMNCAQAVFCAFSDLTGIDEAMGMKLASSFGGGMGRMREVCGAVSGMLMALGVLYDTGKVPSQEEKAAHYQHVQELAAKFKEENGSIICRELLNGVQTTAGNAPEQRTQAYYAKRPCGEYCVAAAEILAKFIEENPR